MVFLCVEIIVNIINVQIQAAILMINGIIIRVKIHALWDMNISHVYSWLLVIVPISQTKEGKSPLHMAAIHGRFTRSQILIQNGTMELHSVFIHTVHASKSQKHIIT